MGKPAGQYPGGVQEARDPEIAGLPNHGAGVTMPGSPRSRDHSVILATSFSAG